MKKCPDKNLYASLQENASRSPEQDAQLKLYRSNETACAMFVVGQSTAHGLNMLTKTMDPIMTQWSRPDMANAVRNLARQMSNPNEAHVKALYRAIRYIVSTPNRGLEITPSRPWDGTSSYLL